MMMFRYTVEHNAKGPGRLVVIGRLTSGPQQGKRFTAINVDKHVLEHMLESDHLLHGCSGIVSTRLIEWGHRYQPIATFVPNGVQPRAATTTARL